MISTLENIKNIVETYENEINDDMPTPPWVFELIDELKEAIENAIDAARAREWEKAR